MNDRTEELCTIDRSDIQKTPTSLKLLNIVVGQPITVENEVNLDNVCRICAIVTDCIIPIFSGEGLQNKLAEKIKRHLPIKVVENDHLPGVVCVQCASTLLAWHELFKCCLQADAALRAQLLTPSAVGQTSESTKDENQSNIKNESQIKLSEIPGSPQRRDPPEYVNKPISPRIERIISCRYCTTQFHETMIREHLTAVHGERLFHCEDCDNYIDKRYFFTHLSQHAMKYGHTVNSQPKKVKKEDEVKRKSETSKDKIIQTPKCDQNTSNNESEATNEFSDPNDTVDDFGPLPESVLEAIEDSQDSEQNNEQASSSSQAATKEKKKPHKKTRTCPICSKVFTASSSYFYHMKYNHNKSKEHDCDVCGKKFATKANLAEHSFLHSAECRFECKTCGKRSRTKASHYIHEQTHNGVKKHACNQCPSTFRWKTHLMRHIKRHSSEKSHVCATCGTGFTVKCDLLRHMQTHTVGNHTCPKCGLRFSQQRYLKSHMRKKHSASTKN